MDFTRTITSKADVVVRIRVDHLFETRIVGVVQIVYFEIGHGACWLILDPLYFHGNPSYTGTFDIPETYGDTVLSQIGKPLYPT